MPTLRNIDRTAPYMHSGKFDNLHAIAEFYNGGRGHAVPAGVDLQLHWHISSPNLSDDELDRLVDFLGTLTDESLTAASTAHVAVGPDSQWRSHRQVTSRQHKLMLESPHEGGKNNRSGPDSRLHSRWG